MSLPVHTDPAPVDPSVIRDLTAYLAANVDIARIDGREDKAERFSSFLQAVTALSAPSDGFVIVPLHRDGAFEGMSPGAVHGPFPSKQAAITAAEAMDFPSPEWVYIRRLHEGRH